MSSGAAQVEIAEATCAVCAAGAAVHAAPSSTFTAIELCACKRLFSHVRWGVIEAGCGRIVEPSHCITPCFGDECLAMDLVRKLEQERLFVAKFRAGPEPQRVCYRTSGRERWEELLASARLETFPQIRGRVIEAMERALKAIDMHAEEIRSIEGSATDLRNRVMREADTQATQRDTEEIRRRLKNAAGDVTYQRVRITEMLRQLGHIEDAVIGSSRPCWDTSVY